MKKEISSFVAEKVKGCTWEQVFELIEIPPNDTMGDFAIPCFSLAGIMHKNPAVIAKDLKTELEKKKKELGIEKAENAGGYCNIYVERRSYVQGCMEKMRKENFGVEKTGTGKQSVWIIHRRILQKIFM